MNLEPSGSDAVALVCRTSEVPPEPPEKERVSAIAAGAKSCARANERGEGKISEKSGTKARRQRKQRQ
jgi:hypothetical protein